MQMKALRSENLAKLSSSNSTSEEYWVTWICDGTPAGNCLSQIRCMSFSPLSSLLLPASSGQGCLVSGNIEQCGCRWQAAVRYRRIGLVAALRPLTSRLGLALAVAFGLGGRLRLGRFGGRGCGLLGGLWSGCVRLGVGVPDSRRLCGLLRVRLGFGLRTRLGVGFGLRRGVRLLGRDARLLAFAARLDRVSVGIGRDCGDQ